MPFDGLVKLIPVDSFHLEYYIVSGTIVPSSIFALLMNQMGNPQGDFSASIAIDMLYGWSPAAGVRCGIGDPLRLEHGND